MFKVTCWLLAFGRFRKGNAAGWVLDKRVVEWFWRPKHAILFDDSKTLFHFVSLIKLTTAIINLLFFEKNDNIFFFSKIHWSSLQDPKRSPCFTCLFSTKNQNQFSASHVRNGRCTTATLASGSCISSHIGWPALGIPRAWHWKRQGSHQVQLGN